FPAPTETMFLTPWTSCRCGMFPVRETWASHLICALGDPGSVASAASMSSWILFFRGQAGVVSTTRIPIVWASITATSWIILRSIIGRCSSGSCTRLSTVRTSASLSWLTAIESILPGRSNVAENDLVDQALDRREVIRKEHPIRRQVRLRALEELARREIEGDVRLAVGVDQDDVVAAGLGGHPVTPVSDSDVQVRLRHVEVATANVDDLRVELDTVDRNRPVDRGKLSRHGSTGQADERDLAGHPARSEIRRQQHVVPVAVGVERRRIVDRVDRGPFVQQQLRLRASADD